MLAVGAGGGLLASRWLPDAKAPAAEARADRPVLEAYAYPKALPTTFIYDRKGKLLEMHRGPMSEASLRAQLDEALSR